MNRWSEVAIKCLHAEAEALLEQIPHVDESFERAVEIILACSGKLIVTGVGKSGHIGAKIAATLSSTGTPSFFVNPLDVFHGDLGVITPADVVLAISNSGQTDELLRFLPYLKEHAIPVIGMSGNPQSLLALHSNAHLNIAVSREAEPLGLAPTSSTTATLAMGDALACALMTARNFKSTDFAQFHPGGSLGRRLLTTVGDVMYKNNLPLVPPTMSLAEALIVVSRGRLGLSVVMDEDKIAGIVTDGDIRRAMESRQQEFFNLQVSEIMSPHPKKVSLDAKLADAEDLLNRNKIHAVLVADADDHLLGIVDSFALNL